MYARHEEYEALIPALPEDLFSLLDDQSRLSAHMSKRSWKMAWGKMETVLDANRGQAVGSHIVLRGRVLGISLYLDEVVTVREPPLRKAWETVGPPRLLVIGPYRMGFDLTADGAGTRLRVAIAYDLPPNGIARLLGLILGRWYAQWCTRRMAQEAADYFMPAPDHL